MLEPNKVFRKDIVTPLAILGLGLFLLTFKASTIPGMHGDEGFVLMRAEAISQGSFFYKGLNGYTGAAYHYLVYPFVEMFGYTPRTSRFISALLALGTVSLMMMITSRITRDKKDAWWLGLLLLTSPVFIVLSRFSVELTALCPLLIASATLLLLKAWQDALPLPAVLSGVAFGLAADSHILSLSVPLALAGMMTLRRPRSFLVSRTFWLCFSGLLPFLIYIFGFKIPGDAMSEMHGSSLSDLSFLIDFPELPEILGGILNGSLIFQRYSGGSEIPVIPYVTSALLLCFTAGLFSGKKKEEVSTILWTTVAFCLVSLITWIGSPMLSIRYFVFTALAFGFLFVFASRLGRNSPSFKIRLSTQALLLSVVILNCVYLSSNYFFAHEQTGGRLSIFPLGARLMETSNHFTRSDLLYKQLQKEGVEIIVTEPLLLWSLAGYDVRSKNFGFLLHWDVEKIARFKPSRKIAYVVYNGASVENFTEVVTPPSQNTIEVSGRQFVLAEQFDPHFRVYLSRRDMGPEIYLTETR